MGDPKKQRRKYSRPVHPWQKSRIDEEKELLKEYGLKNKKELWKMEGKWKSYSKRVKKIREMADTERAQEEEVQILKKVKEMGIIKEKEGIDGLLSTTIKDILNRRLQTLLVKKNLAKTIKEARQFITHGHITIAGKKIKSPSYLVSIIEESKINFSTYSVLDNESHPQRYIESKEESEEIKN